MARVCGLVCAHVFTLPEIRSFLVLPSLHPEVFTDPSNQLNKSNRAEWASDGSALACGAEHWVGGRPRWRLWLPAAGCRSPAASSRRRLRRAPGTARACVTPGTGPGPREEDIPYKIAMVLRKGSQQNIE